MHLKGRRSNPTELLLQVLERQVKAARTEQLEDCRRSAELLGEPDEKSSGPADVAEPIRVFVLHHFAADQLRAALAESGERLVDVVHSEHDAEVAESVDRRVPVSTHQ